MLEVAALVVSVIALAIQGFQARRESVKDDRPLVRGLVQTYVKLDAWRTRGAATNAELHAYFDPIINANPPMSDDEFRRYVLETPNSGMLGLMVGQLGILKDIVVDDPADYEQALELLTIYASSADAGAELKQALFHRGDLLRGASTFALGAAARNAELARLAELLDEADESVRLLNQATDSLRDFIRETIPMADYEAIFASLR